MIKRLSFAITLFMLCLFTIPQTALAFDPFSGDCSGRAVNSSAICKSQSPLDPSTGQPISNPIIDNLTNITNIIAFAGGVAAIIIMIVSALKLITSGSDASTGSRTDTDVEDARRSIVSALIGLAIIILARLLILFVLKKL